MAAVVVMFTVPYNLSFPQGGNKLDILYEGKKVVLIFENKPSAKAMSYDGREFAWACGGYKKVEIGRDASKDGLDVFREIVLENPSRAKGYIEYSICSHVTVIFFVDENAETAILRKDDLTKWALSAFQYFLEWYRLVSMQADVGHVAFGDIAWEFISATNDHSIDFPTCSVTFPIGGPNSSSTFRFTDAQVAGLFKPSLSESAANELKTELAKGEELPLYYRLINEAMEFSFLKERHAMSVVASGTSLEIYLQQRLAEACVATGTLVLPVGKKDKPYAKAIEEGNVRKDLLRWASLLSKGPIDIQSQPEYKTWVDNCYGIRNEIIHRGRTNVSRKDAENAINATSAFICYLAGILPSSDA